MKYFLYSLGWLAATVMLTLTADAVNSYWFLAAAVGCELLSILQFVRCARTL